MSTLKDIIEECKISYSDCKQLYESDYKQIFDREKDWLNNTEEKTYRLSENIRNKVEYIITKLKDDKYLFIDNDTEKLSAFVSQINSIIRIANRINNFKEKTLLDNTKELRLFELFNKIKATSKFSDFKFPLNKNLNSFRLYSNFR